VLPPVVVGYALLLLFGTQGPIGRMLEPLGIVLMFRWTGAALAAAIMGFPLLVRAVRLGIEAVDSRLEVAARTLGARRWRVFFTVTLPLAWPGIVTGSLLAFARALGEFGATITFVSNIPSCPTSPARRARCRSPSTPSRNRRAGTRPRCASQSFQWRCRSAPWRSPSEWCANPMVEVDIAVRRGTFAVEAAFASDASIVALFGKSGAGKSTIVNAIAGIARPSRGRIVVGDRVLFDSSRAIDVPPERRRVGYVFQDALLFPHLSVRANLAYGETLTPATERFVDRDRVLDLLGLRPLLDRGTRDLSGGEKQRVAIGRALLSSPRVLLMDEPLASLDAARKAEILQYVELLRDELRLPIVYVSHAIEEVTRLADHLVLVADGRTVAEGPTAGILARPELRTLTGRYEAGAVVETRVARHDESYGLTVLAFADGELVLPNVDALIGEPVRARIRARDVSIALERPRGLSVQNVLEATIVELTEEFGAIVDVELRVGATPLIARITRKAAVELSLAPGKRVYALVKAVSIDRRSVGFA
jgi:molybdate transport system ATP-binding protein